MHVCRIYVKLFNNIGMLWNISYNFCKSMLNTLYFILSIEGILMFYIIIPKIICTFCSKNSKNSFIFERNSLLFWLGMFPPIYDPDLFKLGLFTATLLPFKLFFTLPETEETLTLSGCTYNNYSLLFSFLSSSFLFSSCFLISFLLSFILSISIFGICVTKPVYC